MRQWGKEERRIESQMSERDADWDDLVRRIRKAVQEWRDENPTATLTEIENAVDDELVVLCNMMDKSHLLSLGQIQ